VGRRGWNKTAGSWEGGGEIGQLWAGGDVFKHRMRRYNVEGGDAVRYKGVEEPTSQQEGHDFLGWGKLMTSQGPRGGGTYEETIRGKKQTHQNTLKEIKRNKLAGIQEGRVN